jgi:hypothetical protein
MSRYNGVLHELTKPFVDVAFLIFVGVPFLLAFAVLAVIYDAETAQDIIDEKTGIDSTTDTAQNQEDNA